MNEHRWIELLGAARDGTMSEADLVEIETRLRSDPVARREYLHFMQVHSLLEQFPPEPEEGVDAKVVTIPRYAVWAGLAAAALVVALAVLSIVWLPSDSGKPEPAQSVASVPMATLILSEGCVWADQLVEGQRLSKGVLSLKSGTAVVRFDGGAEVIFSGKTQIELIDAGSGRLHFGDVIVRAEDGAEGFTLETPTGRVVDLGTEFAVKVDTEGTSEVHVLDGQVAVGEGPEANVIEAGRAVRIGRKAERPQDVEIDPKRFSDSVKAANPQPQLELMLAYEGFNYGEGSIRLKAGKGGKGWAGPWRLRHPDEYMGEVNEKTPDELQIVHGEMNVTWPVAGGRKGMLDMGTGMRVLVRELENPINMDQDGVTYVSLMVREIAPENKKARHEAIRLTLRASQNYFGPSVSFGYGGSYRPHVQTGSGVGFVSPMLAARDQTTLWIGKIVSRKNGEDEIYFRIYGEDEVFEYAEPAAWHVATRGVDQSVSLDRLLITTNGATSRIVDEIRIGPTWRSVVPFQPLD